MKKIKPIITMIALVLIIVILGGLSYGYYKKTTLNISNPIVTMEVENYGTIKIELYPDVAPNTVSNFVALINNGFYNGLKFHRIDKEFMIQGGDEQGDGTGSPSLADVDTSIEKDSEEDTDYSIEGEFSANGFNKNNLNLTQGVITMARSDYSQYSSSLSEESYNSAGSQFFIMTSDDYTNLSGRYAGFGKVIEGMDVVQAIANVECTTSKDTEETEETTDASESTEETSEEDKTVPVTDVIIKNVSVDTFGVDYGVPETQTPFNYMKWLYAQYGLTYNEE